MPNVKTFWPADFKRVGARFGELSETRRKLGLGAHRGLDFKVPEGTDLVAIGNGSVVDMYWSDILGWNLEIRVWGIVEGKRKQVIFCYSHLLEDPAKTYKIRDKVKGGEFLCKSGNTGKASSGAHLHLMAGLKKRLSVNPVIDPLEIIKASSMKEGVDVE